VSEERDPVDRMFRVLVRTIRAKHPAYLTTSFTVSDLQSQILPYRHFRKDLGLESNQEYELTIMRLLSGEHGYLEVDERLRDEFSKELASSSPEPSRVREFGDSRVSLSPTAVAVVTTTNTPVSQPSVAMSPSAGRDAGQGESKSGSRCRFCGGELPPGRDLNFCPHCGQNLRLRHCPACGAESEPGWKFCVSCGKAIG